MRLSHIFFAVSIMSAIVLAGPISIAFKKVSSEVAGKVATETSEAFAKKSARRLVAFGGDNVANDIIAFANKHGIDADTVTKTALKLGKNGFPGGKLSDDVLKFSIRNGDGGIYLIKRFGFNRIKNTGWAREGTEAAVAEAWRLADGGRIGGSWRQLQKTMNQCGITGSTGRDFCEDLFAARAKAGRIQGLPKGTELFNGHYDSRHGIDFILPDEAGKLRVIEFGSGKKPSHPAEMTWGNIREQLAKYVEANSPDLIRIRGEGVSVVWFNARTLRDPKFPIQKYVKREYFAPQLDVKALVEKGSDLTWYMLP